MIREDPFLSARFETTPTVSSFFDLGRHILEKVDQRIGYPILKLSGGEIFLYKGAVDFIEAVHERYNGVQLLTNGLLFSETEIDRFHQMGNVYFQISLDGHTVEANRTRSRSKGGLERILRNIGHIVKRGIGLEINCVLTDKNIGSIDQIMGYLGDIGGMVVFPRPVRGEPRHYMQVRSKNLTSLYQLIEQYESNAHVLPPRAYLERVGSVLERRMRSWDCYVPFFVFGLGNYGRINTCACSGGLPVLGSVLDEETGAFKVISQRRQYEPSSKPAPCADCINQYEIFDLYVEGRISESELMRIPTFRVHGAIEAAKAIKDSIQVRP